MLHTDKKLLKGFRKGETEAFEAVYHLYSDLVRKFLYSGFSFSSQGRACRFHGADSTIDVDAVVQETFLRAFGETTRKSYDGERPFQNYLFSIARNLVLKEMHHRNRVMNVDQCEEGTQVLLHHAQAEGFKNGPVRADKQMVHLELHELTTDFVSKLDEEEQTFFGLRFAQGNTQQATADAMKTTRARIKVLERRLREQFMQNLRQHGYLTDYTPSPRWARKAANEF